MTNGIFDKVDDQSTTKQEPSTDNTAVDQTVYIGEGKKYSSVTEADKAFGHLNQHVETLEQENARLREEAARAKSIDEVLEAMKHQKETSTVQGNNSPTSEGNHQGLSEDAISEVVKKQIEGYKQLEIAEQNAKKVRDSLVEKYGEKAAEVYKQKADELGVDLDQLAYTSPKAVLAYFDQAQRLAPTGGERSSYNTATLNSNQAKHGTHDYWNQMEREGKISREEKFRRQHESLAAMGEAAYFGK